MPDSSTASRSSPWSVFALCSHELEYALEIWFSGLFLVLKSLSCDAGKVCFDLDCDLC